MSCLVLISKLTEYRLTQLAFACRKCEPKLFLCVGGFRLCSMNVRPKVVLPPSKKRKNKQKFKEHEGLFKVSDIQKGNLQHFVPVLAVPATSKTCSVIIAPVNIAKVWSVQKKNSSSVSTCEKEVVNKYSDRNKKCVSDISFEHKQTVSRNKIHSGQHPETLGKKVFDDENMKEKKDSASVENLPNESYLNVSSDITIFDKEKYDNINCIHKNKFQLISSEKVRNEVWEHLSSYDESLEPHVNLHCLEPDVLEEALLEEADVEVSEDHQAKQEPGKRKKTSGKKQKEHAAKIRREKFEKLARETHLNLSLKSYLNVCINANMLGRAHAALQHYRFKSKKFLKAPRLKNVEIYNTLLQGWARKGNIHRLREVFSTMEEENVKPNLQSYVALLECVAQQPHFDKSEAEKIVSTIENQAVSLNAIFTECTFIRDQQEKVIQAIQQVRPHFQPTPSSYPEGYNCKLLETLNDKSRNQVVYSPCGKTVTSEELKEWKCDQIQWESEGQVTVKSIDRQENPSERTIYLREKLKEYEKEWKEVLNNVFEQNLEAQRNQAQSQRGMSLYPYLCVLDSSCYVEIMLQEIRRLAETSETFSPSVHYLHRNLGAKVMNLYMIWIKKQNGVADKVSALYDKYLEYYVNPHLTTKFSPRHFWQKLKTVYFHGPTIDSEEVCWPHYVQLGVGRFMYDILLHDIKINVNVLRPQIKSKKMTPAFYNVFRNTGFHTKEEIKPHPILAKLYRGAAREELIFDVGVVPMLTPPLPWTLLRSGGYLLSPTSFIRLPDMALQQRFLLEKTPVQDLYPSFDSLNVLALCPWIINKPILDLIIEVFRNKGNVELGIPRPPSECEPVPKLKPGLSKAEKARINRERIALKRKRGEMYSLWCDALYKLSIAKHFENKVFWFPHNMDFRGRVYPCPPHFNHLGSDMARSILLFAKGQPLEEKGLQWLKLHVVNLTGFKKRDPIHERLRYAEEVLPDILDSADNPFTGRQWWKKSDEPWQTLSCCMELAKAIRSPDPSKYICHLPIHQDGSCNGLQHYAALGRDQQGAEQVNLQPCNVPQDVYSGVAALVERERTKDAANGVHIAKVLEGFVKRKVVKQTVMTVVYGVTRYGARLQILKQLRDITDFPQDHCWQAASYLVNKTFLSLQEMFTATRQIQDWFTESARLISQVRGQPVEWVTPLGLPIVQPYHRLSISKSPITVKMKNSTVSSRWDMYERPNILKQKNAFPPNFIHSLDSCHMMLTSLFCQRSGITFVSVHDCYWTHANSVETMNRKCREQFAALHSQPILENLSDFLVQKFGFPEHELTEDGTTTDVAKRRLNETLRNIPKKGTFQVENVLTSTYFFS